MVNCYSLEGVAQFGSPSLDWKSNISYKAFFIIENRDGFRLSACLFLEEIKESLLWRGSLEQILKKMLIDIRRVRGFKLFDLMEHFLEPGLPGSSVVVTTDDLDLDISCFLHLDQIPYISLIKESDVCTLLSSSSGSA